MNNDEELIRIRLENERLKKELEEQKYHSNNNESSNSVFKLLALFFIVVLVGVLGYFYLKKYSSVQNKKIDIESLKSNVVFIMNYDSNNNLYSTGSGVLVNENTVYTNYHVIENASTLDIILDDNSKVRVLGIKVSDKKSDIAIIVTENVNNINKINYSSSLKTGDVVYAIGNPLGIKNVVSDGIYSGEYEQPEGMVYQHTAPISHGSSGGGLFNNKGELVGINYATFTEGQNLNLAIKIDDFNKIYNDNINTALVPVKTTNFFNTSIAKNGSKLFSEFCKFDISCDGQENYGFEFLKSKEYSLLKDKVEYHDILDVSSNYYEMDDHKYNKWIRVFIFKIKDEDKETYSYFKDLVNYKAIETRDNYPGLSFNIYYSKNENYYYYIEYKDYDINNIINELKDL